MSVQVDQNMQILAIFLLLTDEANANRVINEKNWDGFYLGSHISQNNFKSNFQTSSQPGSYFVNEDYTQLASVGSGSISVSDTSVGLNVGWNRKWRDFILGIEIDYIDTNSKVESNSGSVNYITQPLSSFSTINRVNTEQILSLLPRLGYVWSNSMVYLTAGLSLAQFNYTYNFSDTFANQTASSRKTLTKKGWSIGAGAEYLLNNNWSIRLEYLYSDFGNLSANSQLSGYPDQVIYSKVKLKLSNYKIGVNYRF